MVRNSLPGMVPGRFFESGSEESKLIEKLKSEEIFLDVGSPNIQDIIEDDEVCSLLCGDDHTDMRQHLREYVAQYIHPVCFFGGPLLLSRRYGGYSPTGYEFVMGNIAKGMDHKKIGKLIVQYHFPCGMADHHKHPIQEVLSWMPEAIADLDSKSFMEGRQAIPLAHVKRVKKGRFSQRTYFVNLAALQSFPLEF